MRFGAEQSEAPNRMTRYKFNNILSTFFTREIVFLYFILFITIQLCYILSNQSRYDRLNVNSICSPCPVDNLCPGAGYLYYTGKV